MLLNRPLLVISKPQSKNSEYLVCRLNFKAKKKNYSTYSGCHISAIILFEKLGKCNVNLPSKFHLSNCWCIQSFGFLSHFPSYSLFMMQRHQCHLSPLLNVEQYHMFTSKIQYESQCISIEIIHCQQKRHIIKQTTAGYPDSFLQLQYDTNKTEISKYLRVI